MVYYQSGQDRRSRGDQRWPRNRQRERVLRLVREHDGAVDAATLADQIGLHVTTARFHLDALCDEGTVARTRIKRAGVGRPRTGYVAVRDRLDYESLAEILALELGDTVAERRQRAERAGQRWASRIVAGSTGQDVPADPATMIAGIFERMGFEPELASGNGRRERTIRLHGCPVRDLAQSHPEVSCGMHLGLLRGLVGSREPTLRSELDPFVEPELCIARVITDD
jgi:predicted ArsR family transcriptional regulator